jgi:hypothetical protein
MKVAREFEVAGRMDAAANTYRQVHDRFATSAEAQDAACRLQALSGK